MWKNNNADVGARSSRPSFNMERIPPVERGGVIPPLQSAKTGHEQTLIQRQIDATDRQIDKLVYELYDLTEEEIAIMEGN
ncbi:MAG: hypothetical protein Q8O28_04185 [Smithellaceae bacterium]|nr:hypothetical protein [Smithellaceae bacterium]